MVSGQGKSRLVKQGCVRFCGVRPPAHGAKARKLVLAALALHVASPAFGQAANSGLPTREELQAGAPPVTTAPPPARHRLRVEAKVDRSPCALDAPAYADIRIRLTKAEFAHLDPVPADAIADTWQSYVGTDQPISVLCKIRDAAATRLRALGYIASVEVPAQRIDKGEVRFEVLYARVIAVRVVGNAGRNAAQLESFVRHLTDGAVFNRFESERYVLLAQDIPGYDVQLTLSPSTEGAGKMIGVVHVDDTPVMLDFTGSDLAGPSTGRIGGQLRASINGLTGLGDQTTLSVFSTSDVRRQQVYQFGHQMMPGGSGLQLAGHFTYATTHPVLEAGAPAIAATTFYENVEGSYPLVRRLFSTLRGVLGLDVVDQNVTFGGAPLSRDRLRVVYSRLDFDVTDEAGLGPDGTVLYRITGSAELRKGLSIFGGSPNCVAQLAFCSTAGFVPPGVSNGNPEASVARASAQINLHALRWLDLNLSPRVQLASGPLLGFEQFTLGNNSVGRGFSPGAIVGDDGAAFSLEARGPTYGVDHNRHLTVQPYAFSDNGWSWRRLSATPNPQELHSLGAGARLVFEGQARLDLSLAVPVSSVPASSVLRASAKQAPLFLMTLSTGILPWRFR